MLNKTVQDVVLIGISIFFIYLYVNAKNVGSREFTEEDANLQEKVNEYLPKKLMTKSSTNDAKHRKPKLKRILYWNEFYGSKKYGFCCGRGP